MSRLDIHTDGLKGYERRELEREHKYVEQQAVLEQIEAHAGGLVSAMKAAAKGDVLYQGTVMIGPAGEWTLGWPVEFQAISIANTSTTSLTVLAGPPTGSGAPPNVGAGQFLLPAGIMRTAALRGHAVTVYGAAGTLFDVALYSRPREPVAGPCGPGGLNIPMSQKGVPSGVAALSAAGSVLSATGSYQNAALGGGALAHVAAPNNVGVGFQALTALTTGQSDVAVGVNAGMALLTGGFNTIVGAGALETATTGDRNTAIGYEAMALANGVSDCTAIGYEALSNAIPGIYNTAIGSYALANTTGAYNTAVGMNACGNGASNPGGHTAVGWEALQSVTTGPESVAVGIQALLSATTGGHNTAIGPAAGYFINGGAANATVAGNYNTFVGSNSGAGDASDPSYTSTLGALTTVIGSGSVAIGTDSGGAGAAALVVNQIALGTANHHTTIQGTPAFVAGDRYLVIDANGNLHKSALGPAS
jgi:hypothetical protein